MNLLKLLLLLLFRPQAALRLMHHRPTAARPRAEPTAEMGEKGSAKERGGTDHVG
jgi:hypothetical protein